MMMAKGKSKAGGKLMRAALQFLKRANKRNRPGRMTPHYRDHTIGGGHVKPGAPKASGYHYRPGGQDFPGRRLVPGTKRVDNRTGAYTAVPEFYDSRLGRWKPKNGPNGGQSTFFPDHWTPAQIDAAIPGAFRSATPLPNSPGIAGPPRKWRGSHNGLTIEGFYNSTPPPGFTHGWPRI